MTTQARVLSELGSPTSGLAVSDGEILSHLSEVGSRTDESQKGDVGPTPSQFRHTFPEQIIFAISFHSPFVFMGRVCELRTIGLCATNLSR